MPSSRPARLTSNLLARKGCAAPAAKPTLLRSAGSPLHEQIVQAPTTPAELRPGPLRAVRPAEPRADGVSPERKRAAGAVAGDRGSCARFTTTIRLDPVRHYRLKLFAARQQMETQDLLVQALDAYLDARAGDCPCLRSETKACSR